MKYMRYLVEVVTQKDPLNIRTGPGTSFDKNGQLKKGDRFYVNEMNGEWYKLENGQGWVSARYAKVIQNMDLVTEPKYPEGNNIGGVNSPTNPNNQYTPWNPVEESENDFSDSYISGNGLPSNASTSSDIKLINIGNPPELVNYSMDYSFVKNSIAGLKHNFNIIGGNEYKDINQNLFFKFNRFRSVFNNYHLSKTFSHIFFTRPDLNIVDYKGSSYGPTKELINEPVYYYLHKNNPTLYLSLCKSFTGDHDFHPFLSNTANSFEISDEYIKTIEHGETFTGMKVMYGKHSNESKSAGTFNVSYIDNSKMDIYKLHKIWVDYISKVYRGEIKSKPEYIRNKILDYACSVYYIICAEDGETILSWTKYFGVFPTNIPSSVTSWAKGGTGSVPEYSINYTYSFMENFSPMALAEFNKNSRGKFVYKKTYEKDLGCTGTTLSGAPFIESGEDKYGDYRLYLRFRK